MDNHPFGVERDFVVKCMLNLIVYIAWHIQNHFELESANVVPVLISQQCVP